MQWLRNLKVSRKFIFAFGIVCSLCVVLGAYSFLTFRGIVVRSADVSENAFPSVIDLANARSAINVVRREDLELLLCQIPACMASHAEIRQKAIEKYQSSANAYEATINDPEERNLYRQFPLPLTSTSQPANVGLLC